MEGRVLVECGDNLRELRMCRVLESKRYMKADMSLNVLRPLRHFSVKLTFFELTI